MLSAVVPDQYHSLADVYGPSRCHMPQILQQFQKVIEILRNERPQAYLEFCA